VGNPARERSRNLNREVWESPSVYGGEDVKTRIGRINLKTLWDNIFRLFGRQKVLAIGVIGQKIQLQMKMGKTPHP
jgi:hypothetical protein